jgi:hypothetical protein
MDAVEAQRRARAERSGRAPRGSAAFRPNRLRDAVAIAAFVISTAIGRCYAEPREGVVPGSGSDWPDTTNTGVSSAEPLVATDGMVVDKPGTVISRADVRGGIVIAADDVTVERSRIRARDWSVIKINPGVKRAVVQDCTIDGMGSAPDGTGSQGIMGQGSFLRNDISNVENGIVVTGDDTLIQGNFIHDLQAGGAPHYDGIQIDGGISNLVMRHNTIINSHGAAGAVMMDNQFGPLTNVVLEDNILAGGSYTIYSDGKFSKHHMTGVSIRGNHIAPGQYGPVLIRENSPIYVGNLNNGKLLLSKLKLTKAAAE